LLAIIAIAVLFRVSGDHFMDFASDFRYVFFLSRLDSFAIGALLFMKYQQRQQAGKYGTIVLAAIVIFLVICFLGFDWNGAFSHPFIHTVGFTLIAAGWAILVGRVLIKPTGLLPFFFIHTITNNWEVFLCHIPDTLSGLVVGNKIGPRSSH
jgi:peptidoglycan/LPS O-acetylase OafA/YrhL